MRPLTDTLPKPLLQVQGKPLMQWHLEALIRGNCSRVVINTAWLGEKIVNALGDVFTPAPTTIAYSHEGNDFGSALETAGGIARALPMLCDAVDGGAGADVFWVVAGDVYAPDFDFMQQHVTRFVASGKLAHVWLVPNPPHHRKGDFGLQLSAATESEFGAGIGLALNLPDESPLPRYTYSSIGLYRKALFLAPWCPIPYGNAAGVQAPLAPLLRAAMEQGQVTAQMYSGAWTDVGTPERLALLNQPLPDKIGNYAHNKATTGA
jgi:MurNAc alpha-1-phosphate uridylyltransferase